MQYDTMTMEDGTFARKAVEHLLANDLNESEWISTVKIILKVLGLERCFHQLSLITTEKMKEMIIKKLQEKFTQELSTSLASQTGSKVL